MKYISSIILLFPLVLFAQEETVLINGEITIELEGVEKEGIHILNLTSLVGTITKKDGTFQIRGKVNDTVLISAIQFKTKKIVLSSNHIQSKTLNVQLLPNVTELDEITLKPHELTGDILKDLRSIKTVYDSVRPTRLGLPNTYVKKISKNKRKLISSGSGGNPIALLINTINGNRKRLKKIIQLEKDIYKRETTKEEFDNTIYYDYLGIPEGKIDDFIHFCSLDSKFEEVTATKDKLLLLGFLEEKSREYKKINDPEKD
ncbi:hypothetical protein GTQ40_00910 [Flavobacteriaceae bacterium R38]|nr:hypothetical protein [Flavobacteriaceae bacterium R38]